MVLRARLLHLLAGLYLASAGSVAAQDADLDPLRFLPSSFSSSSEIDASSVQVYRIPFGFTLRDLADERRWGLRLTLPVSFGFYEVSATTDVRDLVERLETITVSPGLELQVAAGSSWVFKPFGEIGMGSTTSGSTDMLFTAGSRAVGRYRLEPARLTVGGSARYASERASRSRLQDHTTLEVGADVQLPLGFGVAGREALAGVYGIARFLPDVEFADDRILQLGHVYELGISFSTEPELELLGLRLPWIALGYRFGDVFSGVRISLSFPF